jgi:4-diphosphocytidyl-2-C-methyl-D-erythritol kinase
MLASLRNLPAPAKINWFLHVTGRRADGYHLLETVFQLISLGDSVDLDITSDGIISRVNDIPGVRVDDDITIKAAKLLQRVCSVPFGARINVVKRIPMGGGLGGGSSDAATVLLGLNRLWSCGLSRDRLAQIGLQLGADVPVFIHGTSAYATGVGEILVALELEPFPMVLVTPPVNVPTVAIFTAAELTRNTEPITIVGFAKGLASCAQLGLSGRNDLEPVAAKQFPAVKQALVKLRRLSQTLGLNPNSVRMSGSGGCIFVKCNKLSEAQAIAHKSQTLNIGKVDVLWSLSQHPLQGQL